LHAASSNIIPIALNNLTALVITFPARHCGILCQSRHCEIAPLILSARPDTSVSVQHGLSIRKPAALGAGVLYRSRHARGGEHALLGRPRINLTFRKVR